MTGAWVVVLILLSVGGIVQSLAMLAHLSWHRRHDVAREAASSQEKS